MKVEDAIEDAKLANCPEIVHGIPPRLEGIIDEKSLPMVFEEPEPEPTPEPRDLEAEIDNFITELADKSTEIDEIRAGQAEIKAKLKEKGIL